MMPAVTAANTSSARSRYSARSVAWAAKPGRVRKSEPLAFSVPTSIGGGAPVDAPMEASKPRGRRLSSEAPKVSRPMPS